jgi:putative flippase GtrA
LTMTRLRRSQLNDRITFEQRSGREASPMSFEAFKVVHLFGVILFLGNIIVTGVWKVLADVPASPASLPIRNGW